MKLNIGANKERFLLKALQTLSANNAWTVTWVNDGIDVLWPDSGSHDVVPADAILEEINRLSMIDGANQYSRDRAIAYMPVVEQLDLMYHQGFEAWKAYILTVKDAYPKP